MHRYPFWFFIQTFLFIACAESPALHSSDHARDISEESDSEKPENQILPAAHRMELFLPSLQGKRIGIIANHTSLVGDVHLIDTLLGSGVRVMKIFSPEHGFGGDRPDGEKTEDMTYKTTGIPIISLYGKTRKPDPSALDQLDLMVFDMQDVGVRFYTYLSTMSLAMEACAEAGVPFMVLDRPNPNGHYMDGPVLEPGFASFIGMHPIPVVYGMTIGEYAKMVNSEGWLRNGIGVALEVIPCGNYHRQSFYQVPVAPSPNLPNMRAIYLYPSICFFEGTVVSEGRGTDFPFQSYGHPKLFTGSYRFTPQPNAGSSHPKLAGQECFGANLASIPMEDLKEQNQINLGYLLGAYRVLKDHVQPFFLESGYFDKLAGTDQLRKQILEGKSESEIRESWKSGLEKFSELREKYLMYD